MLLQLTPFVFPTIKNVLLGVKTECILSLFPLLQEMFDPPSLTPVQELIALLCFQCFLGKLYREQGLLAGSLPDCVPALGSIREAGALEGARGGGGADHKNRAKPGALRTAWHAARCSGRQALVED